MESTWIENDGVTYGAKPDASGPIGGGDGYDGIVVSGEHQATTIEELLDALDQAKEGETVFVPGHIELDCTEWVYSEALVLNLRKGITLASDRGHEGSPGALLISNAFKTQPLIEVIGSSARITGFRVRGPDPERRLKFHHRIFSGPGELSPDERNQKFYLFPNSDGIRTDFSNLEVDNCEISAWSHGGVYLQDGKDHQIHHCFIHHCQRMGLGYGIVLNRGAEALIEFSLFQDNKHHIACSGCPGSGYEARHNVVLPYTESHAHPITGKPYGQDHQFDMHGGRDRRDGTKIAGSWMKVHHNTFYPHYVVVNIRGVPEQAAEIHHNWILSGKKTDSDAFISDGNTRAANNYFGDRPA